MLRSSPFSRYFVRLTLDQRFYIIVMRNSIDKNQDGADSVVFVTVFFFLEGRTTNRRTQTQANSVDQYSNFARKGPYFKTRFA